MTKLNYEKPHSCYRVKFHVLAPFASIKGFYFVKVRVRVRGSKV